MPTRRTVLGLIGLLPGCATPLRSGGPAAPPAPPPADPDAFLDPAVATSGSATDLFRPSPAYAGVPDARLSELDAAVSTDGPAVEAPSDGCWPSPFGGSARNSRSPDSLSQRRWTVGWHVPLHAVTQPQRLLVAPNAIVVDGADHRGVWDGWGRPTGSWPAAPGTLWLGGADQRFLAADGDDGGLSIHVLPDGHRDAALVLPTGTSRAEEILEGPGVLVFVTGEGGQPSGGTRQFRAAVETIRIRDYTRKNRRGIFYGLDPMAGITREQEGIVRAAATRRGPVLATRGGVVWCDWRLRTLRQHLLPGTPSAISVDDLGRAHLLWKDALSPTTRLVIVGDGGVVADQALPADIDFTRCRPIIAANGTVFLTPPRHLLAFGGDGKPSWHRPRSSDAPGTVTASGQLLAPDEQLCAFAARDGQRRPLWKSPEPIALAPLLLGRLIYVVTERTLLVLQTA